ncbi:hypothetical protein [Arcanobacterium phocae]|uniref:hypothetical protein n=1 Tax=Arcanobacterium phocae TaxID=131112 RepID=UPI001C0EF641|nr:hypothetical protein [Arcanobacterium phocae]
MKSRLAVDGLKDAMRKRGNRHSWASRGELSVAITDWIEGTYHRNHRQNRLGKQTPIQYEDIIKPAIK